MYIYNVHRELRVYKRSSFFAVFFPSHRVTCIIFSLHFKYRLSLCKRKLDVNFYFFYAFQNVCTTRVIVDLSSKIMHHMKGIITEQ